MTRRREHGQATAEFALILPLLVMIAFAVVQVGVVVRDRVALSHATRAAARTAIVSNDLGEIRRAALAATDLESDRMVVAVDGDLVPGTTVTVSVTYRVRTDVAMVGRFIGDVSCVDSLTVVVE